MPTAGNTKKPGAAAVGKNGKPKKPDQLKNENIVLSILGVLFRIAVVFFAVSAIYKAVTFSYDFGYRIFCEPAMNEGTGRVVSVSIEEDMSPIEMGKMMEEKGLSRDWRLFALQYFVSEYKEQVQSGVYSLNTNMTAEEMFAYMASFYREEEKVETTGGDNMTPSEFEVEELSEEEVTEE